MSNQYKDIFDEFKQSYPNENIQIGKQIERDGKVRYIKYRNKEAVGKIAETYYYDKTPEEKYFMQLRGQNIIKMYKIYSIRRHNKKYNIIIMEKAFLKDLGKIIDFYFIHNILRVINYETFDEKAGDNLLRFYSKQIIKGLETLDRNDFVHFDIKPENILISLNLIIKLSDFSSLSKIDSSMKLPKGTQGYMSPEYYIKKDVSADEAKKQDYFALGSTLFELKYGEQLLKFEKFEDYMMNYDRIISLLEKKIAYIKSQKHPDKKFLNFLVNLIMYKPDERPSFEQIYRDKWLNKNNEELEKTFSIFHNDEEKLIEELQKKDFLLKKEKSFQKEDNSSQIKFRFKKKIN